MVPQVSQAVLTQRVGIQRCAVFEKVYGVLRRTEGVSFLQVKCDATLASMGISAEMISRAVMPELRKSLSNNLAFLEGSPVTPQWTAGDLASCIADRLTGQLAIPA